MTTARFFGLVLGGGIVISASLDAGASSLVQMDLEALAAGADRIVIGEVEKNESHYASPGSRTIVTDTTIVVERSLLGAPPGGRVVVRHLGGEVGKSGQRVFGAAHFDAGEHVLLFAVQRGGSYWTLGMSQGVLHVTRDREGVARVATHLAGAELQRTATTTTTATATTNGRPLDDVVAQVQWLVGQRRPR